MAEEKGNLTEDPEVLKALLATTERAYLEGHEWATSPWSVLMITSLPGE